MTDEERKFIEKINIDKAKNKTILAIIIIGISLLTYVIPLIIYEEFDFGIVFEIISLIFLLIARYYMSKYDVSRAKRYNVCAIASVGWLLIYDMIVFFTAIVEAGISASEYGYIFLALAISIPEYLYLELDLIMYILMLFVINRYLSKADNPIKYKESTDWFYENYKRK